MLRLCDAVISLSSRLHPLTGNDRLILQLYVKVRTQLAEFYPSDCFLSDHLKTTMSQHMEEPGDSEICEVCNENIIFEDAHWARCTKGHLFSRSF